MCSRLVNSEWKADLQDQILTCHTKSGSNTTSLKLPIYKKTDTVLSRVLIVQTGEDKGYRTRGVGVEHLGCNYSPWLQRSVHVREERLHMNSFLIAFFFE
jgi:hypothetical protein